LGLRRADETETIGEQRRKLLAAIAEVAEEPVDRGLAAVEGRIVLIPERDLLEKPPQPLDQVEIWRIGRQKHQPNAATFAGPVRLDRGQAIAAQIVEHDVDGRRARMARRQRLELRDHGLAGDLLGLEMDHFAIGQLSAPLMLTLTLTRPWLLFSSRVTPRLIQPNPGWAV
jgi:hypothetical protein